MTPNPSIERRFSPVRRATTSFLSLCAACSAPAQEPPRSVADPAAAASAQAPQASGARASAPSTQGTITYAGGDGSTIEDAIVVRGATNSMVGIRAEYRWLQAHLPGYKRKSQALLRREGKAYDLLEVELPDGTSARVYFDITDFFGKF